MDPDKDLEKKVSIYQQVAKENPNVDVASLMLSALKDSDQNLVSGKQKKWAYLISIGTPPLGLFFALKFYFFDEHDDSSHVGNICVLLTGIAVLAFFVIGKVILSGSGTSLNQIQQIKPQDIYQLGQ